MADIKHIRLDSTTYDIADEKLRDSVVGINVVKYGVDNTGIADVTASVNSLIGKGYNKLYFPSGTYKFGDGTNTSIIPVTNVEMYGTSETIFTGYITFTNGKINAHSIIFKGVDITKPVVHLASTLVYGKFSECYFIDGLTGVVSECILNLEVDKCKFSNLKFRGIDLSCAGTTVIKECFFNECIGHNIASEETSIGEVYIYDNIIQGGGTGHPEGERTGGGIFLRASKYVQVYNNLIKNTQLEAINLENVDRFDIHNNYCMWENGYGDDYGICVVKTKKGTSWMCSIHDNTVENSAGSCIAMDGNFQYCSIRNNVLRSGNRRTNSSTVGSIFLGANDISLNTPPVGPFITGNVDVDSNTTGFILCTENVANQRMWAYDNVFRDSKTLFVSSKYGSVFAKGNSNDN